MTLFSVTPQGIITVDAQEIKESFDESYKQAIDPDLNTSTATPQGQMIINDTQYLEYAQQQSVQLANSFSVFTAQGDELDIAAQLWGYYRKQGTSTVVNVVCSGAAGTVIPEGSLVSDGTYQYSLLNDVTILSSGSVTGAFQCTQTGVISCPSGAINTIVSTLDGWDSVINTVAGITGSVAESDNTFRQRITANWLNARARSILGAIIDNIASLPQVVSVVGRENYATVARIIDGISMPAHSIYVCVLGGASSDIAEVLTRQKTLGAGTVGNISISYYDEIVGYNYEYNIRRPAFVPVDIQVSYQKNYYTPTDVELQIQNTLTGYIAANPWMIGQTVSGSDLSQALEGFPYADILSIKVSTAGTFVDYATMNIEQVASVGEITCVEVTNG